MKKSAALCGVILGVFLLGSTAQAETVLRSMNVRSQPSATSSLIGSVPKGAQVTVLSSQNGWDYVSYNGANGWIHGGNISSQSAAQTAAPAAGNAAGISGQTVKVLYGMNFRANPGMDGRIIGGVPAGTKVQYLGSSNGWDQIIYNGVTGWIASGRISSTGTAAASSTDASAAGTSVISVKVLYGMNFRAKPGMDGRIIGGIPAGTKVQYLGSSNGWDQVVYNGVTGWIASGRISAVGTSADASASAAGTSAQTVKVLYGMNFRAKPGMDGRIMGGIPAGTTVQYLGSSNGWDQVVYNGTTGWIASGRISAVGTTGTTTQAAASTSAAGVTKTVINAMNFRMQPGTDGSLIVLIPAGSKVIYITGVDGWDQVIYSGQTGWIKGGNTR